MHTDVWRPAELEDGSSSSSDPEDQALRGCCMNGCWIIVEVAGSQRVLFLLAVVALAVAWLLLLRLKVPPRI